MFQTTSLAVFLLQINHAEQSQETFHVSRMAQDSNNLTNAYPDTVNAAIFVTDEMTSFDNPDNGMDGSMNTTICSNLTGGDLTSICRFWLQGVILFVVGLFGIVGNSVSIYVLTRNEMLSVFNQILAVMAFIDTLFLVTSMAEFSVVEAFGLTSEEYDAIFVFFLYPMHNVFLTCSIFLHAVLAFERYLAVCHPQLVYLTTKKPPQGRKTTLGYINKNSSPADKAIRKKVFIYVLPVVLLSLFINIPRWLELELITIQIDDQDDENLTLSEENFTATTVTIAGTWLRYNKYYVQYYLHWTILLVTGILPLATLAFLNTRIYLRIREVRKFRTSANSLSNNHRHDPNFAATLASIIVIFVVCHMPRVIKNIYEIVITNQVIASGGSCHGVIPAKCLVEFNNLILTINASSGFLIYCFVGTFGTQFIKVLNACWKKNEESHSQEGGQTQINLQRDFQSSREDMKVRSDNNDSLKTKIEFIQTNHNMTKIKGEVDNHPDNPFETYV